MLALGWPVISDALYPISHHCNGVVICHVVAPDFKMISYNYDKKVSFCNRRWSQVFCPRYEVSRWWLYVWTYFQVFIRQSIFSLYSTHVIQYFPSRYFQDKTRSSRSKYLCERYRVTPHNWVTEMINDIHGALEQWCQNRVSEYCCFVIVQICPIQFDGMFITNSF